MEKVALFIWHRANRISLNAFMAGEWYTSYLEEMAHFLGTKPQIRSATPVWAKLR